jgi:hypothetical protein
MIIPFPTVSGKSNQIPWFQTFQSTNQVVLKREPWDPGATANAPAGGVADVADFFVTRLS